MLSITERNGLVLVGVRHTFGRKAQPRKDRKLEDMAKEYKTLPWER